MGWTLTTGDAPGNGTEVDSKGETRIDSIGTETKSREEDTWGTEREELSQGGKQEWKWIRHHDKPKTKPKI